MKRIKSNKLKAAILLSAFSLNIVIGFACSIGLDMGYNSKHHDDHESSEAVVHIHADGRKHIHHEKKKAHQHGNAHQHEQNHQSSKSNKEKDNCCSDQVLKFEQTDKSVPSSLNIIHPTFLIAFFEVFYDITLPSLGVVKDIKQFVRSYHPPITDIRISIQSFQI